MVVNTRKRAVDNVNSNPHHHQQHSTTSTTTVSAKIHVDAGSKSSLSMPSDECDTSEPSSDEGALAMMMIDTQSLHDNKEHDRLAEVEVIFISFSIGFKFQNKIEINQHKKTLPSFTKELVLAYSRYLL